MEGKELAKLLLREFHRPLFTRGIALQKQVLERVSGLIDQFDLVLVMDFGHGLLEDMIRDYVQDRAGFLAVNCQTNSNNHGFNILNRRYRRADAFTLDQTEITLAARTAPDRLRQGTGRAVQEPWARATGG